MSVNTSGFITDKSGDEVYVRARWNNEFKSTNYLPKSLQKTLDQEKTVLERYNDYVEVSKPSRNEYSQALVRDTAKSGSELVRNVFLPPQQQVSLMERYEKIRNYKPQWHAPWKLTKVINGHTGWIRCVSVDPVDNEWFATGSNDTTIKIWDLGTGKLKKTLMGHAMGVRDTAVSKRHPYMFSASEDKLVKCWDLEKNIAIRDFHGHLSGVHTVDVHPSLDIIVTAGRDAVLRLWDIRSRSEIMVLPGHESPVNKVKCLPVDPQIVSCSGDATIRLWDIVAGKASKVLTHHSRNIRELTLHPAEFSFATVSTNDIRSWKLPEGQLLTNFQSQDSGILNSASINDDDVLFAGGDDGTLSFYDYKTGHKFQSLSTTETAGSLESERSILCSTFDMTGTRLITGEGDKSIKIWKQNADATEEEYPGLPWNPTLVSQRF
ncbi:unnamed protein product [Kluyveromyces dobzhanskii CBS 2104]|uniref:Pre-mRNA-splicing factor PRP46 n=1 Tax=Kluyveromyces dobzhanskii CBS 2104 TaxID=1427455 RepID=A0A0A8LC74_9SACH|nr:unnamed protein product [Kluyveromyces dobzhanskii CBS 2104]